MADWIESKSPGFAAAGLGMLAGVALFGYGLWGLFQLDGPPRPLATALIAAGAVEWLCCLLAVRRNRAAWSFALSLNGVAAVVFLFGAPKVRDGFSTSLGVALIPAIVFIAVTVLFAGSSREYE